MERRRGFSLLELMVVIAIIMVLSAISIPNLMRARQSAYEASAVGTLHTLQTEQLAYRASTGPMPGPSGSGAGGHSVGPTSTIIRNSYIFTLTPINDEQWNCTASPIFDRYHGLFLYTDESGAIRSSKGSNTTTDSNYVQ